MKIKFVLSAIYIFVFSVTNGFAQIDANQIFSEANESYKNGDYAKATELYEQLLSNKYESAVVYYNLGNTYFKQSKIPNSILNYERARILDPSDEDILFNLRVANLQTIDKIEPIGKFFLYELKDAIVDYFSSQTLALYATILSFLAFGLLTLYFYTWKPFVKKLTFSFSVLFFVLMISSILFAQNKYNKEQAHDSAIIFMSSVYVKSSPDAGGTDLFILHDGTKVTILDALGDWKKIRLEDGKVGWAPVQALQII